MMTDQIENNRIKAWADLNAATIEWSAQPDDDQLFGKMQAEQDRFNALFGSDDEVAVWIEGHASRFMPNC